MIAIVETFVGGLGLFLLAVSMITDGLRLAAGDAPRAVLTRSTSTLLRGVLSGVVVTGIVQSSSAVTVATIGFVNAGLLTLTQSFGIIYGANVGTTMTGWIVAAIGFSFKVEEFALPLIGVGMLSRMLRPRPPPPEACWTSRRRRHTGADEIESFVNRLELERLPQGKQGSLPLVLRVSGYLEDVVGLCRDSEDHRSELRFPLQGRSPSLRRRLAPKRCWPGKPRGSTASPPKH